MAKRIGSLTLTLRFAVYLALFSLILSVSIFITLAYFSYQREYRNVQEQLSAIQLSYASSMAEAVWNFDTDQINLQLKGIMKLPNIIYAEVRTQQDIYSAGQIDPRAQTLSGTYDLQVAEAAERGLPTNVGSLYVVSSLDSWHSAVFQRARFAVVGEAITVIAMGLFSVIAVRVMFTKHLSVMASYAKRLNLERLDMPLDLHRYRFAQSENDEITLMENAINEMRLTLKQQLQDRKNTEERMSAQWELLNNVLSNIPSAIFWKDSNFSYVGSNSNFAKDVGMHTSDEIIGKSDYDFPWAKEDADRARYQDMQIIETGQPMVNFEDQRSNPEGKRIVNLMSKVPLKNKNGEIIGILGVYSDITEMKQAEEQIRELNENLEQKVERRTKELQATNSELEKTLGQLQNAQNQLVQSEKMAALGGLVAGVAHEINTPVGIGVTAASYLKDSVEKIKSLAQENQMKRSDFDQFLVQTDESSDIILKNLNRAAELIRGFKQVAVDQSSESNRAFKVHEYINEVLISLKPKLKKTKHTIDVDCDENIEINSNPGAFSHIVTNFVTNSLLHGFENKEEGHIKIVVKREDGTLKLVYTDDGAGIPAENIKQIFDPFFTTKRGKGGSGLGLHVLYNSVTQSLGGTIECKSEVGHGVEFTIRIPIDKK
jgi:PAS domain S-box-containing protein